MNLSQWMIENGENAQSVADKVGVTRSYVHRIQYGDVHPSLAVALAIHDLTGDEVELEQLLPRTLRPGPAVKPPRSPKSAAPDKPRKPVDRKASKSPATA